MKIKITQKGVYDRAGERIPVGTVLNVSEKKLPKAFVNKCIVLGTEADGAEAVTNEGGSEGLVAKHKGGGHWAIFRDEEEIKSAEISDKSEAKAFNAMSDEEKEAFVA